jgi:hypothetical protein
MHSKKLLLFIKDLVDHRDSEFFSLIPKKEQILLVIIINLIGKANIYLSYF